MYRVGAYKARLGLKGLSPKRNFVLLPKPKCPLDESIQYGFCLLPCLMASVSQMMAPMSLSTSDLLEWARQYCFGWAALDGRVIQTGDHSSLSNVTSPFCVSS